MQAMIQQLQKKAFAFSLVLILLFTSFQIRSFKVYANSANTTTKAVSYTYALDPAVAKQNFRLPWVSGSQQINLGYSYGCGDHKENGGQYHDAFAIDFATTNGVTPIAAIGDGIAHIGYDGATTNYGHFVWIAHTNPNGSFSNFVSVYAHLGLPDDIHTGITIQDNQPVKAGQQIGIAGTSGNTSGGHVHFSLRKNTTTLTGGTSEVPEPMSGYTRFGYYGVTQVNGCNVNATINSPFYTASPWLQERIDPQNTGYNPFENILSANKVAKLTNYWSSSNGGLMAFSGGVLYIASGGIFALDPSANGKILWQGNLSYPTSGPPVVFDDIVYVVQSSTDNNTLFAYDASGCGQLICQPLWSNPTLGSGSVFPPVIDENGRMYITSGRGQLFGLDAKTGKQLWNPITLPDWTTGSPTLLNNLVFVNQYKTGKILAYDAGTGVLKKQSTVIGSPNGSGLYFFTAPIVSNNIVYIGCADGKVYELASSDLHIIRSTDSINDIIYVAPIVANGKIYAVNLKGNIFAFNASTGKQLWMSTSPGFQSSDPILVNNVVYYGSENGQSFAFRTSDGKELWASTQTGTPIDTMPILSDGILYVVTNNNVIYTYHLP